MPPDSLSTIYKVNGGAWNNVHVLRMSCDPPTKQRWSCGVATTIVKVQTPDAFYQGPKHK